MSLGNWKKNFFSLLTCLKEQGLSQKKLIKIKQL
ncbi:MAG: hypothetical protein MRERV_22c022 [Mycoplasmataceae bacterium RV_VA103A]|nr:MAG: hypothetical protein MRERV_22c022 [Mycoplasmataceae bacterium RV_VA103A]